jgi:DNA-binding SARP family transcriptional activator
MHDVFNRDVGDDSRGFDFPAGGRKEDNSTNHLAGAVSEVRHLTEDRLSQAVEGVLADLGNAVERTSSGIEAVQKLRMWRADYLHLAAELDAAARSFRLIERGLGRRIDAAIADWERRFEAAIPGTTARPAPSTGPDGWLRGFLRRARAPVPPLTKPDHISPEQGAPAREVPLARSLAPPSCEIHEADISARVLGSFELSVAGVPVLRWNSRKARSIFQYLLMHRDRPVRREFLMELEWPNHTYGSARNNLNVALYNLRSTFDRKGIGVPTILYKEGCYLLNPALTCWIDRDEFLSALRNGQLARQDGQTQGAIDAWRSAVQLYRGLLFEDDLAGEWYLPEQCQLKELYLKALEYLAEVYCDLGQLPTAIEFGHLAIRCDPCCEPVHRVLMRCYAHQHQQQLVSRQFRLCVAAMHDELGVAPASETVQLFRTLTSTVRVGLLCMDKRRHNLFSTNNSGTMPGTSTVRFRA